MAKKSQRQPTGRRDVNRARESAPAAEQNHGETPSRPRGFLFPGIAFAAAQPAPGMDFLSKKARFRVVRIADGVVLSGGKNRAQCENQCRVFNTYERIAEVRAPKSTERK